MNKDRFPKQLYKCMYVYTLRNAISSSACLEYSLWTHILENNYSVVKFYVLEQVYQYYAL